MSHSALSIGIIGLPNVGKSTLFNALLKRQAALAANYPFATIEPNVGVVDVPDPRLERLAEIVRNDYGNRVGDKPIPEKIIPATIKFYDIAGLVKGASQGEGLGNEFLGHIREVDALVHVVRNFKDEGVIRAGSTIPSEDISTVNTELILADLQVLDKKWKKMESDLRGDKSDKSIKTFELYKKLKEGLDSGRLALELNPTDDEKLLIQDLNLLTLKPVIYMINISEEEVSTYDVQNSQIGTDGNIYISAKIESEIAALTDETEKYEFLNSLGIITSGLDKLISVSYQLLGLQTFLTAGPKEVRAWTIKIDTKAPQAAGTIHTDFERGFISAEIVGYRDLDKCGSYKKAQSQGLVRLEGKNYTMHDGDVTEFRFSV